MLFVAFLPIVAWRSMRGPAKPTKKEDLVDLASTFGIQFGDSDSSDAEFAPEDDEVDSEGLYNSNLHEGVAMLVSS